MSVNTQQMRALTFLAKGCRPSGATPWDEAGTMAAIERVADRDLAEVTMAVIRAARDRGCDTPGVIPTAGEHWREQLAPLPFTPRTMDASERCSVCSMTEAACRIRHSVDDHEFESAAMAAKRRAEADPAAVSGAVAALKAGIEPLVVPRVKSLEEIKAERPGFAERLAAIEARLPTPPLRESEPVESETSEVAEA